MLKELIALDPDSKVWIYQSDRQLSYDEVDEIRQLIFDFVQDWSTHGKGVTAYGNIFHRRFVILFADKSIHVSGCSIDASVNFIKSLEQKFKLDFFDRMNFAFMVNDEVVTYKAAALENAVTEGIINEETLAFDNLVNTKAKFINSWLVPVKDSWHKNFI